MATAADIGVTGGAIRGIDEPDGSHLYFGIPYAAPPVGALRWKPPEPVVPWLGARDATRAPSPCAQADEGWNAADAAKGREDCLYLSVRAPAHAAGEKLPVLFWIHGGSNRAGSGYGTAESPIYRKGLIVVSIEYRLGVFGFLSSSELTRESPRHTSGNYALMDQIAALRWVRDNIAAFGGDPARVTIAGQSAGAMDVAMLLRSPRARGLFSAAIQESGALPPPRSAADNEKIGQAVMAALGVTSLDQLREVPAAALLKATATMTPPDSSNHDLLWLQSSADGWILSAPANDLYHNGDQAPVPLLLGDNSREIGPPDDLALVRGLIAQNFKRNSAAANRLYGVDGDTIPAPDPVVGGVANQVSSDTAFHCPVNQEAAWQIKLGQPAWRYVFGLPQPGMTEVAHNAELTYVFGIAPKGATFGSWPPVQDYWANFVKSHDPNGPGLPTWPAMGTNAAFIDLTPEGPKLGHDWRMAQCRLLMDAQKGATHGARAPAEFWGSSSTF
ncbi:MAG TPA: carboxylesterase family protein [Candidatus Sulfopaludibacter sp.]|nr:carboxylesterase family protein [Candidatus Sulfopaludibacter sp.]